MRSGHRRMHVMRSGSVRAYIMYTCPEALKHTQTHIRNMAFMHASKRQTWKPKHTPHRRACIHNTPRRICAAALASGTAWSGRSGRPEPLRKRRSGKPPERNERVQTRDPCSGELVPSTYIKQKCAASIFASRLAMALCVCMCMCVCVCVCVALENVRIQSYWWSDRDFGRTDRDFGRTDRDFGRTDRDFGRTDRDFGQTKTLDRQRLWTDKDFGQTETLDRQRHWNVGDFGQKETLVHTVVCTCSRLLMKATCSFIDTWGKIVYLYAYVCVHMRLLRATKRNSTAANDNVQPYVTLETDDYVGSRTIFSTRAGQSRDT